MSPCAPDLFCQCRSGSTDSAGLRSDHRVTQNTEGGMLLTEAEVLLLSDADADWVNFPLA